MFQKPIDFYSPNGIYGRLSNDFHWRFRVDGEEWKSVSSYIYSNMLQNSTLRGYVKEHGRGGSCERTDPNESPCEGRKESDCDLPCRWVPGQRATKEALKSLDDLLEKNPNSVDLLRKFKFPEGKCLDECKNNLRNLQKCRETDGCTWKPLQKLRGYSKKLERVEQEQIVTRALETAYAAKFQTNKELKQQLMASGQKSIVYASHDANLGTGKKGRGDNLVGSVLEQLRRSMRILKDQQSREKKKELEKLREAEAYTAYESLVQDLTLRYDNLSRYLDKTPEEILAMSESPRAQNLRNDDREWEEKLKDINPPPLPEEVTVYLRDTAKEENLGSLAKIVRERQLDIVRQKQLNEQKSRVATIFSESVAAKGKALDMSNPKIQEKIWKWAAESERIPTGVIIKGDGTLERKEDEPNDQQLEIMYRAERMRVKAAKMGSQLASEIQRTEIRGRRGITLIPVQTHFDEEEGVTSYTTENPKPRKPQPKVVLNEDIPLGDRYKSENIVEELPTKEEMEEYERALAVWKSTTAAMPTSEEVVEHQRRLENLRSRRQRYALIDIAWKRYVNQKMDPELTSQIDTELARIPIPPEEVTEETIVIDEIGSDSDSDSGKEEKTCIKCQHQFDTYHGNDFCPDCREGGTSEDGDSEKPKGKPFTKKQKKELQTILKAKYGGSEEWRGIIKRAKAGDDVAVEQMKEANRELKRLELKRQTIADLGGVEDSGLERMPPSRGELPPYHQSEQGIEALPEKGKDFFIIYPQDNLSPVAGEKFIVNGREYPSVEAYVIVKLIAFQLGRESPFDCDTNSEGQSTCKRSWTGRYTSAFECKKSCEQVMEGLAELSRPTVRVTRVLNKAYSRLYSEENGFTSLNNLKQEYVRIKNIANEVQLKMGASRALDAKFNTPGESQDALLETGTATLNWGDYSDPILGINTNTEEGENYVGEYMMYLREKIAKKRGNRRIKKLVDEDFQRIITRDPWLRKWFSRHLAEIGQTVVTMKDYMYSLTGESGFISGKFVSRAIGLVEPCEAITAKMMSEVTEMPRWFLESMRRLPGFKATVKASSKVPVEEEDSESIRFSDGGEVDIEAILRDPRRERPIVDTYQITDEAIRAIWKRVAAMLHVLVTIGTITDIKIKIAASQKRVTEVQQCTPQGVDDPTTNCIMVALGKLIQKLYKFKEGVDVKPFLLVETATALLLGLRKEEREAKKYKDGFKKSQDFARAENLLRLLTRDQEEQTTFLGLVDDIAPLIPSAVETVRRLTSNWPEDIKKNRWNFFAEQE